jgi:hypothetical protein
MDMRFEAALVATSVLVPCQTAAQTPDQWAAAARAITRLPPAAFPGLPAPVRYALEHRGCTVPQSFTEARPHNVVPGRFARADQLDWAVLCSRGDSSSVLLFWGGQPDAPTTLGRTADAGFLQHIGGGQIGYSHVIRAVRPAELRARADAEDDSLAERWDHDALEDAFAEKASSIAYLEHGRWRSLGGAD